MYIISGTYSNEFKIKGSLFKVLTFEVSSISDIKKIILELNNKFKDASHVCYGYRLCNIDNLDLFYNPEIIEFSNDDGEPSGTAGKPILNVLKKNKIINRIIFIVRYFGGTKLGIPGLIDAYKYGSDLILQNRQYKDWILFKKISIKLDYKYQKVIDNIISDYDGNILDSDFSDVILLNLEVPYNNITLFKKKIIEKSNGTIKLIE